MGLVDKHRAAETVDDLLQRFLVARRGKVKDALKMLKHDLEWREKEDSLTIRSKTAREMLRGDTNPAGKQFHDQMFPHGYLGTCKMGRPIFYQNFGRQFDAEKLEKVANLHHDDLARYNIWMMERLAAKMNFHGQWVIIVDLDGWNLGQLTMKHMKVGLTLNCVCEFCWAVNDCGDCSTFASSLTRIPITIQRGVDHLL